MTVQNLIDRIDNSSPNYAEEKGLYNILNAITDWPTEINSTENYMDSVKNFLGIDEINNIVIKNALKKIDENKFTWEVESIYELLVFLNKNKDISGSLY